MKASVLVLSMVFSSMAFAAKSYEAGPNCSARTTTNAHDKDKLASAKEIVAKTLPNPAVKEQNQNSRAVRGS